MAETLANSAALFNVTGRVPVAKPVLVSGDARNPFLPESDVTPPTIVHSEVDTAIERAQAALLAAQAPDGHWVGELEADSTITSEYLLLCHMLDRVDRDREAKMVTYLRERQLPDGGWSLYEGGPPNISASTTGAGCPPCPSRSSCCPAGPTSTCSRSRTGPARLSCRS